MINLTYLNNTTLIIHIITDNMVYTVLSTNKLICIDFDNIMMSKLMSRMPNDNKWKLERKNNTRSISEGYEYFIANRQTLFISDEINNKLNSIEQ